MRKPPYLIYESDNTQMHVHWQLWETAPSTIEWGLDATYSLGSALTAEYNGGPQGHQHTYVIANLTPGTKYYYRVVENGYFYPGSFYAAPNASANSVNFMAYGDTRTFPNIHNEVAGAMVANYTAHESYQTVMVVVGDLVEHGDDWRAWDNEFFASGYPYINELLAHIPYHSARGNHEETGVLFAQYFPYPFENACYWSFDYGPAHFAVVDQYISYAPGSAQSQWLEADLAQTDKRWKFIYLHEPGWSAGNIGGRHENNPEVQNYIQPLCLQYGVRMVFTGHNHYYARAVVNGVQHITTGGGGAPPNVPDPSYPYVVATSMSYHFCKVEISGDMLDFRAVNTLGAILDQFTLQLPPEVVVTLTPTQLPIIIPASGGSFNFNIAVANNSGATQTFDVWTMLTLPDWSFYGPIIGPVSLTMNAGASLYRNRTQMVPAGAPAGAYAYNAYVGDYPSVIWAADNFEFEKTAAGFVGGWGLGAGGWTNNGESFIENDEATFPKLVLLGNYLNPFNPTTTIRYELKEASLVEFHIFDIAGRLVRAQSTVPQQAGFHELVFDGTDLPSGIYLYRLAAGIEVGSGKMVLMK